MDAEDETVTLEGEVLQSTNKEKKPVKDRYKL